VTACPNNIGIRKIRKSEARFAATESVFPYSATGRADEPSPSARIHARSIGSGFDDVAGTAHGAVILHIPVDAIGHIIIDGDVIDLPDRQRHTLRRPSVIRRVPHTAIVRNTDSVGVLRIEPDIVSISAPRHRAERFAAIERLPEATVSD